MSVDSLDKIESVLNGDAVGNSVTAEQNHSVSADGTCQVQVDCMVLGNALSNEEVAGNSVEVTDTNDENYNGEVHSLLTEDSDHLSEVNRMVIGNSPSNEEVAGNSVEVTDKNDKNSNGEAHSLLTEDSDHLSEVNRMVIGNSPSNEEVAGNSVEVTDKNDKNSNGEAHSLLTEDSDHLSEVNRMVIGNALSNEEVAGNLVEVTDRNDENSNGEAHSLLTEDSDHLSEVSTVLAVADKDGLLKEYSPLMDKNLENFRSSMKKHGKVMKWLGKVPDEQSALSLENASTSSLSSLNESHSLSSAGKKGASSSCTNLTLQTSSVKSIGKSGSKLNWLKKNRFGLPAEKVQLSEDENSSEENSLASVSMDSGVQTSVIKYIEPGSSEDESCEEDDDDEKDSDYKPGLSDKINCSDGSLLKFSDESDSECDENFDKSLADIINEEKHDLDDLNQSLLKVLDAVCAEDNTSKKINSSTPRKRNGLHKGKKKAGNGNPKKGPYNSRGKPDRPCLKDGRKLHCCVFCGAWDYRIPRHLMRRHKFEPSVAKAMTLSPKSRNKELAKLRKEGDYKSNMNKLKSHDFNITVVRKGKYSHEDSLFCPNCHGFFNKKTLVKHSKTCGKDSAGLKSCKMLFASIMAIDKKYDKFSSDIVARMHEDEITNIVKNDPLIMLYGFTLYEKGGAEKFNEISCKIRGVGRLLSCFREQHGATTTVTEMVDPACWDSIVETIKSLVKHSGCESVGVPSLLLRIGRSLAALASAKRAVGIKTNNEAMVTNARNFLDLHEEEWHIYANHALATLNSKKDKTPELLPLTEDIKNLRLFLLKEISNVLDVCGDRQEKGIPILTKIEYSYLQKLVLVRIITFNARRGGEAAKVMLSEWLSCEKWKRQEDLSNIDDPVEKKLAARLKVVYSKGKRKKRVPTIYTEEVQKAIGYLVESRNAVGIASSNSYLFPCLSRQSNNPVRGWDAVNDIASKAMLKKPELVTSTKIRKHMATVLQLLDMNNAELEWVTEHLGHTADVHKTWYRQEASTMELTKVAKLLMAKDAGVSFKNKKMSEMTTVELSQAPENVQHSIVTDQSSSDINLNNADPESCQKSNNMQHEVETGQNSSEVNPKKVVKRGRKRKHPVDSNEEEEVDVAKENYGNKPEMTNVTVPKVYDGRKTAVKVPWSAEENSAILEYFKTNLVSKIVPGKAAVEGAMRKYSILKNRKWLTIKSKVANMILSS